MQKEAEDERDAAVAAEDEAQRQQLRVGSGGDDGRGATAPSSRGGAGSTRAGGRRCANRRSTRQQARDRACGLGGLDAASASIIGTADPDVTPRYREAASVTGSTRSHLRRTRQPSSRGPLVDALSNPAAVEPDRMDVYCTTPRHPRRSTSRTARTTRRLLCEHRHWHGKVPWSAIWNMTMGRRRRAYSGIGFPETSTTPEDYLTQSDRGRPKMRISGTMPSIGIDGRS